MTREEVSIIIGNIPINSNTMDDCYSITEYQEAKAMAIEALSKESCEDVISKQAVDDLERYRHALEWVLQIIDNYKTESEDEDI